MSLLMFNNLNLDTKIVLRFQHTLFQL